MHVTLDEPSTQQPVDPTRFQIRGWAWLEDAQPLIAAVEAWSGDECLGESATLHTRSDVAAALALPDAVKTGFDFYVTRKPGAVGRRFSVELKIRLLNGSRMGPFCATEVEPVVGAGPVASDAASGLVGPVRASLDKPDPAYPVLGASFQVSGWVWHENAPLAVVAVEAWSGETLLGSTETRFIRPDVCAALALPADTPTGFDFSARHPAARAGEIFEMYLRFRLRDGTRVGPFCLTRVLAADDETSPGAAAREGLPSTELRAAVQRIAELEKQVVALRAELEARENPIPPDHLQTRQTRAVMGPLFYSEGRKITDQIRSAFADSGAALSGARTVLDFGCGCGRVLWGMREREPHLELWGCDIDEEAIAWDRANLGRVALFCSNAHEPPTRFPAGFFDAIYSVSVFTHLPEDMQFRWLAEIERILAPGGVCVASVHGSHYWKNVHPEITTAVEARGFDYRSLARTDGLPDFYMVAFHSEAYIHARWGRIFDVIAVKPRWIGDAHDAVVLRKKQTVS